VLLFDTFSRKKRSFHPLRGNLVRIYTCGPSVYNYSHIGNFRTYLFEDVLVRYLRYKGYRVKRVMNITDVEDKAVEAAKKEKTTLRSLARDKIRRFFADFYSLKMVKPDVVAKASEHVPGMIRLIQRICQKGYCKIERDGIYFDVRRFRRYGALRHLKNKKYLGKASGDDYSKEGLWDFRLWKYWSKGDGKIGWKSPFGFGRPGWHIECSAMAMQYLGESFDIHCGGADNIYPHHENEIAQSESATGKKLANFWLHAKHLTINKKKMSKRTGNVFYVRQLLSKKIHPECLRFYLISERYRKPLDFSMQKFERKVGGCENTGKVMKKLETIREKGSDKKGRSLAKRLLSGFESAMDDDLDTNRAFRRIFSVFSEIDALVERKKISKSDAKEILKAMENINSVLSVF